MPIRPTCDRCGQELTEFGAILLGPPDAQGMAKKQHLCITCYDVVRAEIEQHPR